MSIIEFKVTLCRFLYFIINNVCLLSVKSLFLWSRDEKVHICGTAKFIFHLMDIAKIPKKVKICISNAFYVW